MNAKQSQARFVLENAWSEISEKIVFFAFMKYKTFNCKIDTIRGGCDCSIQHNNCDVNSESKQFWLVLKRDEILQMGHLD